jgi:hypothetical protein
MNAIKDQYFGDSQTILEIGSGILEGNQSYLSGYFGSDRELLWTFSDIPQIAKHYTDSSLKYLPINLTSDSWVQPVAHSFERVIGCNCLDTLSYADLPLAFQMIHQVLKPGRILIHVADLNFFISSFLESCIQQDFILLPSTTPLKTIYRIEKGEYERRLKRADGLLQDHEAQFLLFWGCQQPQTQAILINNSILYQDILTFSRKIENVFEGSLEVLSSSETFEYALKQAAQEQGWDILECGQRIAIKNQEVSSLEESYNDYEQDQGDYRMSKDSSIPQGWVRLKAHLHVFACRTPCSA